MARSIPAILLVAACSGSGPSEEGSPPDGLDCLSPGHICTFAGTGDRGWSDDGQQAEATTLFLPTNVAFEADGTVVIVDYNNMRVLRHESDGTLVTVVGQGIHAYATDGIDALETPLENAVSMAKVVALCTDSSSSMIATFHGFLSSAVVGSLLSSMILSSTSVI